MRESDTIFLGDHQYTMFNFLKNVSCHPFSIIWSIEVLFYKVTYVEYGTISQTPISIPYP